MSCLKITCLSEQNSEKCLAKKWAIDVCLMDTSDKCFLVQGPKQFARYQASPCSPRHSLDVYLTEVAQLRFWLLPYVLDVLNGLPWHSQIDTRHSHNPQNNVVGWRVSSCSYRAITFHQTPGDVFQDLTQGAQSVQSGFSLEHISAVVFKRAGAEEVPQYRNPNPISVTNTGF